MTDEEAAKLFGLFSNEHNYAMQQTAKLVEALTKLQAADAINQERAKVIEEQQAEIARLTECVKALEAESLPEGEQ